jgi:hypothetical protein
MAAPHCSQNRASLGLSAPQAAHCIASYIPLAN